MLLFPHFTKKDRGTEFKVLQLKVLQLQRGRARYPTQSLASVLHLINGAMVLSRNGNHKKEAEVQAEFARINDKEREN